MLGSQDRFLPDVMSGGFELSLKRCIKFKTFSEIQLSSRVFAAH